MDAFSLPAVLARIKGLHGLSSDPKLARYLQVTEATVSNWKHERNYPDDRKAHLLAQLAEVNVEAFMAYCAAMRTANCEARAAWLRAARRLAATANISALPAGGLTPKNAMATSS